MKKKMDRKLSVQTVGSRIITSRAAASGIWPEPSTSIQPWKFSGQAKDRRTSLSEAKRQIIETVQIPVKIESSIALELEHLIPKLDLKKVVELIDDDELQSSIEELQTVKRGVESILEEAQETIAEQFDELCAIEQWFHRKAEEALEEDTRLKDLETSIDKVHYVEGGKLFNEANNSRKSISTAIERLASGTFALENAKKKGADAEYQNKLAEEMADLVESLQKADRSAKNLTAQNAHLQKQLAVAEADRIIWRRRYEGLEAKEGSILKQMEVVVEKRTEHFAASTEDYEDVAPLVEQLKQQQNELILLWAKIEVKETELEKSQEKNRRLENRVTQMKQNVALLNSSPKGNVLIKLKEELDKARTKLGKQTSSRGVKGSDTAAAKSNSNRDLPFNNETPNSLSFAVHSDRQSSPKARSREIRPVESPVSTKLRFRENRPIQSPISARTQETHFKSDVNIKTGEAEAPLPQNSAAPEGVSEEHMEETKETEEESAVLLQINAEHVQRSGGEVPSVRVARGEVSQIFARPTNSSDSSSQTDSSLNVPIRSSLLEVNKNIMVLDCAVQTDSHIFIDSHSQTLSAQDSDCNGLAFVERILEFQKNLISSLFPQADIPFSATSVKTMFTETEKVGTFLKVFDNILQALFHTIKDQLKQLASRDMKVSPTIMKSEKAAQTNAMVLTGDHSARPVLETTLAQSQISKGNEETKENVASTEDFDGQASDGDAYDAVTADRKSRAKTSENVKWKPVPPLLPRAPTSQQRFESLERRYEEQQKRWLAKKRIIENEREKGILECLESFMKAAQIRFKINVRPGAVQTINAIIHSSLIDDNRRTYPLDECQDARADEQFLDNHGWHLPASINARESAVQKCPFPHVRNLPISGGFDDRMESVHGFVSAATSRLCRNIKDHVRAPAILEGWEAKGNHGKNEKASDHHFTTSTGVIGPDAYHEENTPGMEGGIQVSRSSLCVAGLLPALTLRRSNQSDII